MPNEIKNESTGKLVSSAEFTALWRSSYPSISFDRFSQYLVSQEGREQAAEFIRSHDYPLVARKISARAGYLFTEAVRLVETYHCDSLISFACGYSLLGFVVSQSVSSHVDVVDTDLSDILLSRQSRFKDLPLDDSQRATLNKTQHLVFDIEKARLEGVSLASYFEKYQRPVVILEGITYFLQPETRNWLISELKKWNNACVIIEYWPENSLEISEKLKQSFEEDLNKDFKENLKSFMLDKIIDDLKSHYSATDIGVGEAEKILSDLAGEEARLMEQNEYYPIRIFTGVPVKVTQESSSQSSSIRS